MTEKDNTAAAQLLIAFNHELRRRILRLMADGKLHAPRDISRRLAEPLSKVSYHVRVLKKCKAIMLEETKPVRGSLQHFYRRSIEAEWAIEVLEAD
jgi:DNA-binding transcriptional ArsR family regulator